MKNKKKTIINASDVSVVNHETGEIYDTDNGKKKITIESYLEEDEEEKTSRRFMDDVTFIRSFRGNGILMNEHLTPTEIAIVMFLNDFVCYDDCVLRMNGDKKKPALTVQDLAEMMGSKYDTFRKNMSSLKAKQVIAYHNCGEVPIRKNNQSGNFNQIKWISVNPYLFCRGVRVDDFIKDYFADSVWANVPRQKVRKYRDESEY